MPKRKRQGKVEYRQSAVMARILADRPHEVGAEIGVNTGQTAGQMLELLPGIRLYYCIDRWRRTPGYAQQFRTRQAARDTQAFYNDRYSLFLRQVALKHLTVICPIRMESVPASRMFDEETFDWIFIDDDHAKTLQSIRAWWRNVRPGGIMFGHDYLSRPKQNWDVIASVKWYFRNYTISLEPHTVWWVEKDA